MDLDERNDGTTKYIYIKVTLMMIIIWIWWWISNEFDRWNP